MALRPETIPYTVITTAPDGDTNYDISTDVLPPGLYLITLFVDATVSGSTTNIQAVGLHSDGSANDITYRMAEPDDSGVIIAGLTLSGSGSKEEHILQVLGAATGIVGFTETHLINGLRIVLTVGDATEGEALSVKMLASRVG